MSLSAYRYDCREYNCCEKSVGFFFCEVLIPLTIFHMSGCSYNALTQWSMYSTCDDECIGNSGLSEHALYVAGKELESLAATAVRVHQYHDSARPPHLCIHSTWDTQREVKVSGGRDEAREQEELLLCMIKYFKEFMRTDSDSSLGVKTGIKQWSHRLWQHSDRWC